MISPAAVHEYHDCVGCAGILTDTVPVPITRDRYIFLCDNCYASWLLIRNTSVAYNYYRQQLANVEIVRIRYSGVGRHITAATTEYTRALAELDDAEVALYNLYLANRCQFDKAIAEIKSKISG